jgi:preprotein translocase subunit SecD
MEFLRLFAPAVLPAVLMAGLASGGPGHLPPARAQSGAAPTHRGCLSFHQVHQESYRARQHGVPTGFRVYPPRHGDPQNEGHVLSEIPVVTGSELADAEAGVNPMTSEPTILLRFGAAGTQKLAAFTRANVGQALAIVIDGRVVSAPSILEPILGGHAQIGGSLTKAEAAEIAARLRSKDCPSD